MKNNKTKAFVIGTGMITSVGHNSETTYASVQAGINRYQESMYLNKLNTDIIMALVPNEALPELHPDLLANISLTTRQIRMLRLATPALNEVLVNYTKEESIPLFLAGPEKILDCPVPISELFLDHLVLQTGANINREKSQLIPTGRAAGLEAIAKAFDYFETTGNDYALVGGVDTYCDFHLLGTLDRDDRIKIIGSTDAFAPGEAASFILLVSEKCSSDSDKKKLLSIHYPGIAEEKGHLYSDETYQGDGLSNAFKIAIDNSEQKEISHIYSSMNGENYFAKEYGVAVTRNSQSISSSVNHLHYADCFADIGAAFGSTLIALASHQTSQLDSNYSALVYCSSDNESRAAICINSING